MAQKTAWDGATLTEADILLYLSGEGGAWSSWSPSVTQSGSVTVTNTRSTYARYGRTIHGQLSVSVTGTGTGANSITISLPVTAAASNVVIGQGTLKDASASNARFGGIAQLTSTTLMVLISTNVSVATPGALGSVDFTAGLASGDDIFVSFTYEAAS